MDNSVECRKSVPGFFPHGSRLSRPSHLQVGVSGRVRVRDWGGGRVRCPDLPPSQRGAWIVNLDWTNIPPFAELGSYGKPEESS